MCADITSVCVLEGFSDTKSVQLADSIVKEICDNKAEETMKVCCIFTSFI